MRGRSLIVVCLGCLWISGAVFAEGAGGVEWMNWTPGLGATTALGGSGVLTDSALQTFGGYGYGVLADGSVIGGFGTAVAAQKLNTYTAELDGTVTQVSGGFGGLIQGLYHRFGPLSVLADLRLGFGGCDWLYTPRGSTKLTHATGFALLGSAEVQLGIIVLPWFTVAGFVGYSAVATFPMQHPMFVGSAPVYGLRLAWGSF